MTRFVLPASALLALALGACSESEPAEPDDAAADFAARINGGRAPAETPGPASPEGSQPLAAPTVVPPRRANPGTPPPANFAPVTMSCKADRMGPFLGRQADEATRLDIMSAAQGATNVRFVDAGSEYIASDPANPQLNIMLDARGIIRDAKCG